MAYLININVKEFIMFKYKILLLCVLSVFAYCAKTNVSIVCDELGSTLYMNGKKNMVLKSKSTLISLPNGHYELMVSKPLDEDWHMVGRRNIDIVNDSKMQINLSLNIEKISKKKNTSSADNFSQAKDTVIDKVRKLVWQDDKEVIKVEKNWIDAQSYCKSYKNGKGWRLPNYGELMTIVDYTKHTLAIMPAFRHIVSEYYWTSTEAEKDRKKVKNIYFGNGCPDDKPKSETYFIRCVRDL